MLATPSERSLRVLCVFPHPRFSGHAVVDERGLVPRATFTMRTRRFPTLEQRIDSIEDQLRYSVRAYRPDILAIVRASGCAWVEGTIERILAAAETAGLPLHTLSEGELDELLRQPGVSQYDQLGQSVTTAFFPELLHASGSWRRGDDAARRRVRPMWKAAAGALATLAVRRPEVIVSIARAPIPPGLASLAERASRHPSL